MKRVLSIIALFALLMVFVTGCGSGGSKETEAAKGPADLTGSWKVSNDTFKMSAVIEGETITVYWEDGDTKSLYWAGSYKAPETADEPYTWSSENDHSQTDTAMLASSADTKDFTYEKGELSFEASAMGITSTVRMKKD